MRKPDATELEFAVVAIIALAAMLSGIMNWLMRL